MQGYFVVHSNENEEFDIKCELHPRLAKDSIPEKEQILYVKVERTNSIIKSLRKTSKEIKTKYFNKLLTLSQAGLVGETAQPELALNSLTELQNEMVLIEGQRIKNEYMKSLGIRALILGAATILVYIVSLTCGILQAFSMYCLAVIGALIGTWISFGARKFNITFEQLSLLEEDMMSPWIRLIYICVCSAVFLLFLRTQLISFGIGEISTISIKDNPEIQISIGVLCGLVESKIGVNIYKKAVTLISDS